MNEWLSGHVPNETWACTFSHRLWLNIDTNQSIDLVCFLINVCHSVCQQSFTAEWSHGWWACGVEFDRCGPITLRSPQSAQHNTWRDGAQTMSVVSHHVLVVIVDRHCAGDADDHRDGNVACDPWPMSLAKDATARLASCGLCVRLQQCSPPVSPVFTCCQF